MRGGYALILIIAEPSTITTRSRVFHLPPGTYVYSGSALGPGGIEGRVKRHLALFRRKSGQLKANKYHWHIDYLLATATTFTTVCAEADRRIECLLLHGLKKRGACIVEGFGNSDCKSGCGGHLAYIPCGGLPWAVEAVLDSFSDLGLQAGVYETYN